MTVAEAEPEIVRVAQRIVLGTTELPELLDPLRASFLHLATPARAPALPVADLGASGRWTCVFSTKARLAEAIGASTCLGMRGADLLDHLPGGIGLVLDRDAPHAIALPPTLLAVPT